MKVSHMAENLIGSEIIKLAQEINEKISKGEKIYNLTIGDFNPKVFPIPAEFKQEIIRAFEEDETNYPVPNGMPALRKAISHFLSRRMGASYNEQEILVSGGARPLIYSLYRAVVDEGDTVVYPAPSWNNNHYTQMLGARAISVETRPENNFMPTAEDLAEHLGEATLLSLCSPLNPTGTVFTRQALQDICKLVAEENDRRQNEGRKPLYLMYDQIYWTLTHGETQHFDPVSVQPSLRPYCIFIDGMSKSFAATGVRIGWAFGPEKIIQDMKSILSHVGAWSPKAEQIAAARYLMNDDAIDRYLNTFKSEIMARLEGFYTGFMDLKKDGFPVDAIAPQAAIYLTIQVDLTGKQLPDGTVVSETSQTTQYLLNKAKLGLVPFNCFGSSQDSTWYRLSVGTCTLQDVQDAIASLRNALSQLK
ncbi:MAG: pyridoxal phosphate-dependent aminotransferase [Flavobacteriales bacterium]|nr:pyridoxal phosphate-dependent aminotransferase [Flavobacteriales bacterium]